MEETENSFELIESQDAIRLVPGWEPQTWWYLAAAGLAILFFVMIKVAGKRRPVSDPHREKIEAYMEAKKDLETESDMGSRDTAVWVSEILRRYLARSMQESALFETHEEFVSRNDALKDLPDDVRENTGALFARLAEGKYAVNPPRMDPGEIRKRGLEILERIHAA